MLPTKYLLLFQMQTVMVISRSVSRKSNLSSCGEIIIAVISVLGILMKVQKKWRSRKEYWMILLILRRNFLKEKFLSQELKGDEYYTIKNLHDILRDDTIAPKFDEGEDEIRDGFDSLLAFFGRLEYLLRIGLIRRTDLSYFQYYIDKASGNKDVREYAKLYNFQLNGMLDSRLNRGNKEK